MIVCWGIVVVSSVVFLGSGLEEGLEEELCVAPARTAGKSWCCVPRALSSDLAASESWLLLIQILSE